MDRSGDVREHPDGEHFSCGRVGSTLATIGLCLSAGTLHAQRISCEGIAPVGGEELRVEVVASGLEEAVDVTAPPGDTQRVFVVERQGRIRIVYTDEKRLLPRPFLEIDVAVTDIEEGLLGLTFHPEFQKNHYFYVNYVRDSPCSNRGGETVIARYKVSDADPDVADPTVTIVLTQCQPRSHHNGGQIQFGPLDGYLYAGFGDGGDTESSQDGDRFLGKILRIDVDGEEPYGIPPDNPFVDEAAIRDEIWALGLRNPWRFGFDALNGDLFIGDVGQFDWEEVNYQPGTSPGGENYEWCVREGENAFERCETVISVESPRGGPLLTFPHKGLVPGAEITGDCITGGVVYRGCRMPELRGTYFFSSWLEHWFYSFRFVDGRIVNLRDRTPELSMLLNGHGAGISKVNAFGTDARGEIYICGGSQLFRIVPADDSGALAVFRRGDANGDENSTSLMGSSSSRGSSWALPSRCASTAQTPMTRAPTISPTPSCSLAGSSWAASRLSTRGSSVASSLCPVTASAVHYRRARTVEFSPIARRIATKPVTSFSPRTAEKLQSTTSRVSERTKPSTAIQM